MDAKTLTECRILSSGGQP